MASQVFDLRPSKGMTRSQSNEHLRNFSERAFNEKVTRNFDPTRQHLNFEVTKGGVITPLNKRFNIDDRIKISLEQRGIKDPNEGLPMDSAKRRTTVLDIILQGSRDRMRELAFGTQVIDEGEDGRFPDNSHIERRPEIEAWAKDMYAFMCKRFGEENIPAFVVHLDEKNPHIHCTLIPTGMIKGKIRISSTAVLGKNKYEGRVIIRKFHDDLAEVNKKWGLERGRDIRETKAKHRTTEDYWKWLSDTCSELEDKQHGQQREINLLSKELAKAQTRVKGLTTMVENLEAQREELSNKYTILESDYIKLDMEKGFAEGEKEELERNMSMLQSEISRINESIADKKEKLENADKLLADIQAKYNELNEKVQVLSAQQESLLDDVKRASVNMAQALAWNYAKEAINEARLCLQNAIDSSTGESKQALTDFQKASFNQGFLDEMAENAENLVGAAVGLFLGYLDEVTQFAETHGGGGGSTQGWGRDDDEDDWKYMKRCFGKARQMLKKTSRSIKR